ncbi:MAG: hypothetical protein ACREGC_03435, partial [Minisyncoccia bacterium]
ATIAIKSKNPELAASKAPITGPVRDQNGPGGVINKDQGVSATSAEKGAVSQKQEGLVNVVKTTKESEQKIEVTQVETKKTELDPAIQKVCDSAVALTADSKKKSADSVFWLAEVNNICKKALIAVTQSNTNKVAILEAEIREAWQKVPESKTYQPSSSSKETSWGTPLLTQFLENPSIKEYESLCQKGERVKLPVNKEQLSSNRTEMVSIPYTLYEAMRCGEFLPIEVREGLFEVELKPGDSDNLRTKKLLFMESVEKLKEYEFVMYEKNIASGIDKNTGYLILENETGSSLLSIYIPEVQAMKLLEQPSAIRPSGMITLFLAGHLKI